MNDLYDQRKILADGSIIQLLPYVPKRFNSGDVDDSLKSGSNDTLPDSFVIEGLEGKGSSAVCYRARKIVGDEQLSRRGILKEFYPVDFDDSGFEVHLDRTISVDDASRNQLYAKYGTFENFFALRSAHENSYAIINEKRNKDSKSVFEEDLNKYIPHYSYYCGIPSMPESDEFDREIVRKNTSFYVWVENEAGYEQFQEYLDELCDKMRESYERNINIGNYIKETDYILRCILELAKCIQVLHRFALYHLDLNPYNFGVQLYSNKVDKDNAVINLYDTNSLLYGMDPNRRVFSAGTRFFRSEEVKNCWTDRCGIQSDIYSIGTILFYALVIKENNGFFKNVHFCEGMPEYSKAAFDNIAVDLANSELLNSSDETRSSLIQEKLALIIKKSLNRFNDECGKYCVVEDMVKDIEDILENTGFGKLAAKRPGYRTSFNLVEEEEASDKEYGAAGAIEKLLIKRPLYKFFSTGENGEKVHNVLVLGCGAYASEFIDFALELSQIKDCMLHITVATKDCERRKKDYLNKRKSLRDFVVIDGNITAKYPDLSSNPYGYLDFSDVDLDLSFSEETSVRITEKKLRKVIQQKKYSYVFIALNEQTLNSGVANICANLRNTDNTPVFDEDTTTIAYVQYRQYRQRTQKNLYPVNVAEVLSESEEYRFLKQMAFNIHMSWYKDYINDFEGAEREFRKKYNFSSSMENSLSIVYKLHSVGIELDFDNPEKAALEFSRRFQFDKNGIIQNSEAWREFKELIWYEHRRWVLEKITNGWKTMPLNEIYALTTTTKNEANKSHPCIVPSEVSLGLSTPEWNIKKTDNRARWNDTAVSTQTLDPLDRLSVEFHRHWAEIIKDKRTKEVIRDKCELLCHSIAGDRKLLLLCESLLGVINDLFDNLDNGKEILSKYKHIVTQIIRYAKECKLKEVTDRMNELGKYMLPIVEYTSFTDWKMKDDALIRNLPFILTYNTALHLCVPLYFEKKSDNTSSGLFSNIASALMLNPKYITYVVDSNMMAGDKSGLLEALNYASNIVDKHGLQTKFNIKLLFDIKCDTPYELIYKIKGIQRICAVDLLPYNCGQQTNVLHRFLMQKSSQKFTAIEINETALSDFLQSANYVAEDEKTANKRKLPVYRFDAITRSFITDDDSASLEYVKNSPILFMEDLYTSKGGFLQESKTDLYFAYKKTWELYSGQAKEFCISDKNACGIAWKMLCKAISEFFETNCKLIEIHCDNSDFNPDAPDWLLYVPDFCEDFLEKFLSALNGSENAFFAGYSWEDRSSNMKELVIKAPIPCVRGAINSLMSDPLRISQDGLLDIVRLPDGYRVNYKPMLISDLALPEEAYELCWNMLEALERYGLIRFLRKNDPAKESDLPTVSFAFAGEPIIRLLLSEGYLFKLHTYYEALKSGFFDDVSMGVEVTWSEEHGTKNEIDVVLTKGFQTLTVECKATNAISHEFYHKLYTLPKTFGINTIPVLLVDSSAASQNDMEIQRGRELGIETICDSSNIAQKLNDLFRV